MPSTRNGGIRVVGSTPGSSTRQELRYMVALHVKQIAKRNPNVDVVPVENPYVIEYEFALRTEVEYVTSYIKRVIDFDEIFRRRFEGYSTFDTIYGLKIWSGKNHSTSSSLKSQLKSRSSLTINENTINCVNLWKDYVKKHNRKMKVLGNVSFLVDVGIVLFKAEEELTSSPPSSSQSNLTPSSVSLSVSISPRKRKKSYLELAPPNKILVHIMKPVHLSKNDSTPETLNTNVVKSVTIDFAKYTSTQNLVSLGDDLCSDDGEVEYSDHCFVPFRKELARHIINNEVTWQNYSHCLGAQSGLFFLKRGRKYAEEIKSTAEFVSWVKKYGHSVSEGETRTVEINAAFGKAKDPVNDDGDFKEEASDFVDLTQIETVEPTTEFDKKKKVG